MEQRINEIAIINTTQSRIHSWHECVQGQKCMNVRMLAIRLVSYYFPHLDWGIEANLLPILILISSLR